MVTTTHPYQDTPQFRAKYAMVAGMVMMYAPYVPFSVLDVGCAYPHWLEAVERADAVQNYVGVELRKENLQTARDDFPDAEFVVGDFMEQAFAQFDVVVWAGIEPWVNPYGFLEKIVIQHMVIGSILVAEAINDPFLLLGRPDLEWVGAARVKLYEAPYSLRYFEVRRKSG